MDIWIFVVIYTVIAVATILILNIIDIKSDDNVDGFNIVSGIVWPLFLGLALIMEILSIVYIAFISISELFEKAAYYIVEKTEIK